LSSSILALVLLSLQVKPMAPAVPVTAPHADYPVHVRLTIAKGGQKATAFVGYGKGEIMGDQPQPFSFTYTCEAALPASGADEFYQGRWKTPNLKLDVLTSRPGSTHVDHCELEIAIAH